MILSHQSIRVTILLAFSNLFVIPSPYHNGFRIRLHNRWRYIPLSPPNLPQPQPAVNQGPKVKANSPSTAGPSGCALSRRLADSAQKPSVLLIEAGEANDHPSLLVPGDRFTLFAAKPELNWGYKTLPQKHLKGQEIDYSRGKGLGGSTAINFSKRLRVMHSFLHFLKRKKRPSIFVLVFLGFGLGEMGKLGDGCES